MRSFGITPFDFEIGGLAKNILGSLGEGEYVIAVRIRGLGLKN